MELKLLSAASGLHYCEMKIHSEAPPVELFGRLCGRADPSFSVMYTHTHTELDYSVIWGEDVVQKWEWEMRGGHAFLSPHKNRHTLGHFT